MTMLLHNHTQVSAGVMLPATDAAGNDVPDGDEVRHLVVTAAPEVQRLLHQARQIAASKVGVLIEGETGTGKELIARHIHACSPRSARAFVRVNCAALAEGLVESELFGHEKGSFTSAEETRMGRFELARGGTLLLDEISELPLRVQAKLLRVLEEEEFERVGGTRTLSVDVRVLATTNRDLEGEAATGAFRRDLFYRLNGIHLRLPPLRERPQDIEVLARHFLQRYRPEAQTALRDIAGRTLTLLRAYSWPGNVRQLRNAIRHACLLAAGPDLQPGDLPPLVESPVTVADVQGKTLAEVERHLILKTLHELGGNKTAAANRLGITTRTLLNKLNKYRQFKAA
jgi:DNA-binding NtrC family response regulator